MLRWIEGVYCTFDVEGHGFSGIIDHFTHSLTCRLIIRSPFLSPIDLWTHFHPHFHWSLKEVRKQEGDGEAPEAYHTGNCKSSLLVLCMKARVHFVCVQLYSYISWDLNKIRTVHTQPFCPSLLGFETLLFMLTSFHLTFVGKMWEWNQHKHSHTCNESSGSLTWMHANRTGNQLSDIWFDRLLSIYFSHISLHYLSPNFVERERILCITLSWGGHK